MRLRDFGSGPPRSSPPGSARSWLARDELAVAHYVSLLRSMGCTGNSRETTLLFGGDDRAFVGLVQELAGGDPRELVRRMADHVSSSTPELEGRARRAMVPHRARTGRR